MESISSAADWRRTKDTGATMRVQHPLLKNSEVLQHVLLPLLSAREVLRLGLTCRALLNWVMSTPPSSRQVRLSSFQRSGQASVTKPRMRQAHFILDLISSTCPPRACFCSSDHT